MMIRVLYDQPGAQATGLTGSTPGSTPSLALRAGRKGLTLLEVIVATAIFLLSLVAIWQLFLIGGDRALDVKLQARTSMICQSKLAEATIGPDAPSPTGDYTSFTDEVNKDLKWKMEVESGGAENLWTVKIWVKAELQGGRVIESHLTQMVLDPKVRGSTLDPPPPPPPATP